MATNRTENGQFAKGQSGNPNGRPRRGKALTEILEQAGSKTFLQVDGKRISGKRLVARQIWDAIAEGKVTFVDGSSRRLTSREWREMVEWLYDRIEGKAKQTQELSGPDKGPVPITLVEFVKDHGEPV